MTYPHHQVDATIAERFVPLKLHLTDDRQVTRPFQVFWTPTILVADRSGKVRYTSVNYLPPDDFLDILDIGEALVAMRWQDYDTATQRLLEVEERRADGPLTPEAIYWRGITAYFANGRSSAASQAVWQSLSERFPESIWAKRVL